MGLWNRTPQKEGIWRLELSWTVEWKGVENGWWNPDGNGRMEWNGMEWNDRSWRRRCYSVNWHLTAASGRCTECCLRKLAAQRQGWPTAVVLRGEPRRKRVWREWHSVPRCASCGICSNWPRQRGGLDGRVATSRHRRTTPPPTFADVVGQTQVPGFVNEVAAAGIGRARY